MLKYEQNEGKNIGVDIVNRNRYLCTAKGDFTQERMNKSQSFIKGLTSCCTVKYLLVILFTLSAVDVLLGNYSKLVSLSPSSYSSLHNDQNALGRDSIPSETNTGGITTNATAKVVEQPRDETADILNKKYLEEIVKRVAKVERLQEPVPKATRVQNGSKPRPAKEGEVKFTSEFSCSGCFKHDFKYLIENDDVCTLKEAEQSIDVLFLILTVHGNVAARNALRKTWLTVAKNNTANIRYVFLLGFTANSDLNKNVLEENMKYKDIIQEDFKDAYMNLTIKTIMGYKWAATKCSHAKVVVKTDDDMFINIPKLLKVIADNRHELPSTVLGSCAYSARPNRNSNSKWYASVKSYHDTRYPGFCSGTCYVTSMNVVQRVYKISESVPFFHLEDVYIGLCLRKINAKVKNIPGFFRTRPKLDPCFYKSPKLVTSHLMTPPLLLDIWKRQCSKH